MLQDIDKAYIAGFLDNKNFINHTETTQKTKHGKDRVRFRYRGYINNTQLYPLRLIQLRYGGNLKTYSNSSFELKIGPSELGFMLEDLYEFSNRQSYWKPIIEWHNIRKDNINEQVKDIYANLREKCDTGKYIYNSEKPKKLNDAFLFESYLIGSIDEGLFCYLLSKPKLEQNKFHYSPRINFSITNPIILEFFKSHKQWEWKLAIRDSKYFNDIKDYESILDYLATNSRAKRKFFIESLQVHKLLMYGDKNPEILEKYRSRLIDQEEVCKCSNCKLYLPESFMDNEHYCNSCRKEKSQIYYQENREEVIARVKNYNNRTNYKPPRPFSYRFRRRLKRIIGSSSIKANNLVGCSPLFLRQYIESLWAEGMTWGNYGLGYDKWVIDHIIPVAAFNLENEKEVKKCFHYTNLQPKWYKDNELKSDLMPDGTRGRDKIK